MAAIISKSPTPVRLSLRYSNGVVESHNVRAIGYDENTLRVVSSREFEKGSTLTVLAPFLEGISTCWVFGCARSQELPGSFELVLQFAKRPVFATASPTPLPHQQKQRAPARHDAMMQEATELLINGLYRLPPPRFSQVLHEIPAELRSAALVSAAAAVVFLLQQKGLVNLGRLIGDVQKGVRESPYQAAKK
jgi:hypothetical protein